MTGGRVYVDRVTIGGVDVFEVVANPNGALSADQGSIAIRSDTAETWQNLDGGTSWGRSPFDVIKQRIQLADLPAAGDTGAVSFGPTIEAERVATGWALRKNVDVDVGASGITSVTATLGTLAGNMISAAQLVGGTAAPTYLNGFTNDADWTKGALVHSAAGQPVYQLICDVTNLDQLVAFDITFYIFLSPVILDAP